MPRTLTAQEYLEVARRHLVDHVQPAWHEPTDWDDLALYGFYCLEAAVMAAATHVGWATRGQHPDKARAALRLQQERGLPNIQDLLDDLNAGRKAVAYGDVDMPSLDAETAAMRVEGFLDAVARLINGDAS